MVAFSKRAKIRSPTTAALASFSSFERVWATQLVNFGAQIGVGQLFFVKQLVGVCKGSPNALCFSKITNGSFKISQKMKGLQNSGVSILFTIGNENITEDAQCVQQLLLPCLHRFIQMLLTIRIMVIILSLTGNLGDVR